MSITTLATAKAHLRVDAADEDTIIQLYLNGTERAVSNYLNRALYAASAGTDTTGLVINEAVTSGILLQLAVLYENREPTEKLPVLAASVRWFLDPYRIEMGV